MAAMAGERSSAPGGVAADGAIAAQSGQHATAPDPASAIQTAGSSSGAETVVVTHLVTLVAMGAEYVEWFIIEPCF